MLVLDISLPGELNEGSGGTPYAQTMAFTTLVFFSLFRFQRSVGVFSNKWLVEAVLLFAAAANTLAGVSTVSLTAGLAVLCCGGLSPLFLVPLT